MQNYVQSGKVLELTAPSGGVTSGVPVLIGDLLVVPVASADETEKFSGEVVGVFECAKATGEAWTEGDTLYWDNGNSRFTSTASGNYKAGVVAEAAASAAALGKVRFDGIATSQEA